MGRRRLTQRDVAQRAGVSQAIVSHVLNGTRKSAVSVGTRQRVLTAIDELGYVRDGSARGMRTGRSMLIGAVIPDITNPFYPAFQRGLQDTLETANFSLVSFNTDGRRDRELAGIRTAIECGVDGLIVSLFQSSSDDLEMARKRDIPIVVYGTFTDQELPLSYDVLNIDMEKATQEIIHYLHSQRHRSIGLIEGPTEGTRRFQRLETYRSEMARLNLPSDDRWILRSEFSVNGGYEAASRLLEMSTLPTALIAANDVSAMGVLARLSESGIQVPHDISVVGWDDIPSSRFLQPALTTVALHPESIGERAAKLLLDRLNNVRTGDGVFDVVPHEVIIRDSA